MIAIIKRHVYSRLSTGEEQTLLFGILSNDVHLSPGAFVSRQAVDDTCPRLAGVVRAIDVVLLRAWRSWLTTKTDVGKDVGGIDIVVSGFNSDKAHARRKISEVRDVGPGLAAVHRVVDLSVAAPRPYDTLLNCRDRKIRDRSAKRKPIRSCCGTRRRSRRGRRTARYHRLTFRCSEIGAKRFPRLCAVTRYEKAVVTDV